jgi:hypothetical protein
MNRFKGIFKSLNTLLMALLMAAFVAGCGGGGGGTPITFGGGGVGDPGPAGPSFDLKSASTYGLIAGAAVTLNGSARINGDLAIDPLAAGSPTGTGTVSGTINNGNAAANQARLDQNAAFADASTRVRPIVCTVAGDLSVAQGVCVGVTPGTPGPTYGPGLYNSTSTLNIGTGSTIILDAGGNPDAVFIFRMAAGSAFTTFTSSNVQLAGLAQAKNVWWVAPAGATLGVTSVFAGTVLADTGAVTVNNGTTVAGRVFSNTAAATVETGSTITVPAP